MPSGKKYVTNFRICLLETVNVARTFFFVSLFGKIGRCVRRNAGMSLLGLDVGTTGTKAVAFDLDGRVVGAAYREYPLISPQPGWQELDPDHVWSCVKSVLAEVARATRRDPIQSLGISCQGEACMPLDKQGRCLANSLVTFDERTADKPAWWLRHLSKGDVARISGMPLHGMYTINKIMWFKENRPDVFAKTWKFLCFEDFVQFRLGLSPVMSYPLAARTMAFDLHKGDWSDQLLGIAGIDRGLLPLTKPSGENVGVIPDAVADEIGLPRGVVVATGGHDQPAGALGAGILESGEAMYATGTVECICAIFDAFKLTDAAVEGNVCCYPSCVPGLYASLAFNFTGGALLKWYRDTFATLEKREAEETGRDVYDIICEKIENREPESILILPHFTMTGTPWFDTASRGAMVGLTFSTSRDDIVSAILSGVTYEMKLNLDLLLTAGIRINRLRAIGGGAKSPTWVQRKADIMGLPIAVLEITEAAALGVAMLGGKAAGVVDKLGDMARHVVKVKEVREPDANRHDKYQELFEIYRDIYPSIKDVNHRLAALKR
jgi:xylulokinase